MKTVLITVVFLMLGLMSTAQNNLLNWISKMEGSSSINITDLQSDISGNIYISGYFDESLDMDPGAGITMLTPLSTCYNESFMAKYDAQGSLLWAFQLNATLSAGFRINFEFDMNGDIILTSFLSMNCTVDLDPGPGTYTVGSANPTSFIAKYNPAGNFISLIDTISHPGGHMLFSDIEKDNLGNLIFSGYVIGTIDLDPGPAVQLYTSSGNKDGIVMKYNSSGNYQFAFVIAGPDLEDIDDVETDGNNNIIISGMQAKYSTDFDPGPGIYNAGYSDDKGFVAKYDPLGNLIWVNPIDEIPSMSARAFIEVDSNNDIYLGGTFSDTIDIDPGPALQLLGTNLGDLNNFMMKLTSSGSVQWARQIGSISVDGSGDIILDGNEPILCGWFNGTLDLDPGAGQDIHIAQNTLNSFVLKLDTAGNYIWGYTYGGRTSKIIKSGNQFITAGNVYETEDFEPTTNVFTVVASHPQGDIFIADFDFEPCMSFVIDSVNNITCTNIGYGEAIVSFGVPPYTYSWNTNPVTTGNIVNFTSPGLYTVTVSDSVGCTRQKNVLVEGPNYLSDIDMRINLINGSFRPGFPATITLDVENTGCNPASGVFYLVVDSMVNYSSSSIAPDIISGDTLFWNYSSLDYNNGPLVYTVEVYTPATVPLGTVLHFPSEVVCVTNEMDYSNNTHTIIDTVIGSYDPNDKKVYPAGVCQEHYILNTQKLTYTVRFQNTGSADAINVFILDEISDALDINSVQIVSSSHDMVTEVVGGNTLKFKFDNIHLPDSGSNEPASHGYVIYEIEQMPALPNGTVIENTAYIYFDFNEPVITNTTTNTVIDVIPQCTVGMDEMVEKNEFFLYPNPAHENAIISGEVTPEEILVLDISGRMIQRIVPGAKTTSIPLENMTPGLYLISLKSDGVVSSFKLIKN